MNRSDLIRATAETSGITLGEVEKILDAMIEMIQISLSCGESVQIRNFGRFEARHKNATIRKNPRTGADIPVPEKMSIVFHGAPALKDRINR